MFSCFPFIGWPRGVFSSALKDVEEPAPTASFSSRFLAALIAAMPLTMTSTTNGTSFGVTCFRSFAIVMYGSSSVSIASVLVAEVSRPSLRRRSLARLYFNVGRRSYWLLLATFGSVDFPLFFLSTSAYVCNNCHRHPRVLRTLYLCWS